LVQFDTTDGNRDGGVKDDLRIHRRDHARHHSSKPDHVSLPGVARRVSAPDATLWLTLPPRPLASDVQLKTDAARGRCEADYMPNDNPLGERGRALEDEYFRRVDRELLDRARRTSVLDDERRELGALTGLQVRDVEALQAQGFSPDTVALLPLVPLVQVAWAEGRVGDHERTMIVRLARARRIMEGSPADQQLEAWFSKAPRPEVFTGASRLVGAMLEGPASVVDGLTADELMEYCEQIAAASGGFLGRVGAEELALLTTIAHDLKGPTG